MIPYGRQSISEEDIAAICDVLRSNWLTTGPEVAAFEENLSAFAGSRFGVAVNSGTAALHCAMHALGVGKGDEVIVPPITFAATSNAVLYTGAKPVFADVDEQSLLLDPRKVADKITPQTRAIVGVDYAGHPCDWDALRHIADEHGLSLIADACHAIGGEYKGRMVGSLADISVFSFHPVKHIATGEGGMVLTDSKQYDTAMRTFRNHGITTDFKQREQSGTWAYDMVELGHNLRIPDILCALGNSQLKRLPLFVQRRREIARRYDDLFSSVAGVTPLSVAADVKHSYHLYPVKVSPEVRQELFTYLRDHGIGVNVHYRPVHLHSYYRNNLGTRDGDCPVAESEYRKLLSLPMFPDLTREEQDHVVMTIQTGLELLEK